MIVSYETLRTLQDELAGCPIGLLLADEGHRLKNAGKHDAIVFGCKQVVLNRRHPDLPIADRPECATSSDSYRDAYSERSI